MVLSLIDLQILVGIGAGKTQAQIGEELSLEQPAISKLLGLSEARAELQLVEHRGRRLALTPAGSELVRAGNRALDALDELRRLVLALRAGSSGPLRLIASSTPGSYLLPEVVAAFVKTHPDADIQVEIMPVSKMWDTFARGSFDFAIAPLRGLPPGLSFEPLYADPVVFFVAPDSPLAGRKRLEFADLGDHVVVAQFVASHWKEITRGLEPRGFVDQGNRAIISPEAVKRIVGSGFGVGVVLESSIRRELLAGTLVRLPISDPTLNEPFCLARRSTDHVSPIAEEFRRALRAHLGAASGGNI
jgi:DNA-binding transcriptional LysR family regulator